MSRNPPLMPNEDYEAIEAAVMDTARGRWFLAEFARRNRNADTQLLLDAIARLEGMLAMRSAEPQVLPKPHAPIVGTAVATSADSELFAMPAPEPAALPQEPHSGFAAKPDDHAVPVEIVEIDVEHLILPTPLAERAVQSHPEAIEPEAAAPEPPRVPAPPPPLPSLAPPPRSILAAALAQAEQSAAQVVEQEQARTGFAIMPVPASPVDLDALSFEEKAVYFA